MDYKYINQLLDRYWKGETSLEEEQILRSFFSQICVPEELAKYRPLFNYEQTETKTDRLGDDFDERIMSMIDEPQELKVKAQPIRISQRFAPLFKAAAMVAIVLTLTTRRCRKSTLRSPCPECRWRSTTRLTSTR